MIDMSKMRDVRERVTGVVAVSYDRHVEDHNALFPSVMRRSSFEAGQTGRRKGEASKFKMVTYLAVHRMETFRFAASEIAAKVAQMCGGQTVLDELPKCKKHKSLVIFNGCLA